MHRGSEAERQAQCIAESAPVSGAAVCPLSCPPPRVATGAPDAPPPPRPPTARTFIMALSLDNLHAHQQQRGYIVMQLEASKKDPMTTRSVISKSHLHQWAKDSATGLAGAAEWEQAEGGKAGQEPQEQMRKPAMALKSASGSSACPLNLREPFENKRS